MSSPLNQLPDSSCGSTPGSVPVFNCIVILQPSGQSGKVKGRVANLEGISGEASGERELLFLLTRRFRDTIRQFHQNSQPVPWKTPAETPAAGEQLRFIPIHL
ncbi:MAG: hypothetical protein ACKO2P_05190 [Planctomycetota bacterium]